MLKTVAQHRLGLQSQDSLSESTRDLQRKGTIRNYLANFTNLRKIAQSPPERPQRQVSKIIENNPLCSRIYYKFKSAQKLIYLLVEDSTSSIWAKAFFFIITLTILFTTFDAIITSAIGTTPALQWMEFGISIIYLGEYVLRMVSATAFGDRFFKVMLQPLNIIDICGLLPFFIELGLDSDYSQPVQTLKLLRLIRLAKIVRVLKLGRYLKGAEVFYLGIKASLKSFGFLLLVIACVNVVGATAIYYAEQHSLGLDSPPHPEEHMNSMIEANWYVLVTLATVGYGDYVPQTILGKIIASILAIAGMLIFSLPIAILGNNFQKTFTQQAETEKVQKYKESKFTEEQKHNLTDSKKEVYFMNERIRSIEQTNKAIISTLTESEVLYKQVAKDLKNLYESVYADEDSIQKKIKKEEAAESVGTPFLGSKIDTRIKLYEKLNRAKKKINLAALFKKVSIKSRGELLNTSLEGGETEGGPNKSLVRTRTKKSIVLEHVERGKTKLPTSKIDLNGSDIIETEAEASPNDVPNMGQYIKMKSTGNKTQTLRSRLNFHEIAEEEERISEKAHKPRLIVKSHSVGNQNSFLTYYVQNLNFIPIDILEELIEDAAASDHEDDESVDSSPEMKKSKVNMGRRASVCGSAKASSLANQLGTPERKRRKKKTRVIDTTNKGKLVPKNYDSRIWELTGKILERMEAKVKIGNSLSMLEKTVGKTAGEITEIDQAINAAQNEIKRLQLLKKQKMHEGDSPITPLKTHEILGKAAMLCPHNDNSWEVSLGNDVKTSLPDPRKNESQVVDSNNISVIKEEDSFVIQSGRARNQEVGPGALKNARWRMLGSKMT